MTPHVDGARFRLDDEGFVADCRRRLDGDGVLVLAGFFTVAAVAQALAESMQRAGDAFFADSTHNVYLTDSDAALPDDHAVNRQVLSTKGILADDQISSGSPLRAVYDDGDFRRFLGGVLDIDEIHPYADSLSSVNVHLAPDGRELGWHFDNSSFAVTMLLQAPDGGGTFEYVPDVRGRVDEHTLVDRVLDGIEPVRVARFEPGDLVLFRGRDALHRVTPTVGVTTRVICVFAYNTEPGIGLSDSALATFYGRTA